MTGNQMKVTDGRINQFFRTHAKQCFKNINIKVVVDVLKMYGSHDGWPDVEGT